MKEPRWITFHQIIRIHEEQLAIFGGPLGLQDEGMLQPAIDRPRNKWAYGETEIPALAAAYAFGLARNHPFIDGNKRAAFAAMVVFLVKNELQPVFTSPAAVDVMMRLAAGDLAEEELAAWIAANVRPAEA